MRREVEYRRELVSANEKAMHDQLTGVKNKNAYQMLESSVQNDINEGKCKPFAVLICDLNDLKKINDTFGHKAGDRYIQSACNAVYLRTALFSALAEMNLRCCCVTMIIYPGLNCLRNFAGK